MLKLVVSAPGGRKAELECEPSSTFGDVKARIQQVLGVPPDKQKLLCNGKERKDAAETLQAAGVSGKSKLMLMLAPGYQMPAAPVAATAAPAAPAEATADVTMEEPGGEAEAVELNGEMPMPDGSTSSENSSGGIVHVRHGRNRYHVKVPKGLGATTFGELSDYLVEKILFPPGIPSHELRLISKGKTAERSLPLAADSASEASVMLLFREGFHLAAEGANWLRERDVELVDAEALLEKLGKRIEANFCNEETHFQLQQVAGLLETLKHCVEIVRVREASLPEMAKFKDRVLKADAKLQEMKKGVRL